MVEELRRDEGKKGSEGLARSAVGHKGVKKSD